MLGNSTGMLEVAEERHGEPIELFADLTDISKLEDITVTEDLVKEYVPFTCAYQCLINFYMEHYP